jgi:putative long chain acyl-CoA synthase
VDLSPKLITESVSRLSHAAENALEVLRFGGLETGEEPFPFEVAAEHDNYRLRRYFPEDRIDLEAVPPVLLVPPLMLSADVYDVAPSTSAVGTLREHGVQAWVVDFGAPEREQGGLERTLADHVLAISDAVDRVREATSQPVSLAGYSQGGMFCYQTAAYRRTDGIASLVTFGSPVDIRGGIPLGLPEGITTQGAEFLAENVLGRVSVPAWMSRTGFRMLDPVKSLRQRLDFIRQLHDRDALLPRERQRRFLLGEGWVAWPGPALADFMRQFVAHNRMLAGGFTIQDRLVTLADIECPVLTFVGEVDEIAPADGVRAITRAAPHADVYEVALHAGHFGLVVGSAAAKTTWPTVARWARWGAGEDDLPELVVRSGEHPVESDATEASARDRVRLAAGAGVGLARSLAGAASRSLRSVTELSREAAAQLPRLVRLERMSPETRVSLGLVLDEQASAAPENEFFLYEDRAYDRAAVKERIDNVVRGLISLGVREGEHVGVLMGTRPSALAVIAALSRLGAVAVLLRPGGDLGREAELGRVERVVADPENAELAASLHLDAVHSFVLGGGGEERDLGLPLTDMERIDPDRVELPAWYRPNPGRADDVAFVVFTGQGERTHASRITNGRWALSAFGTASSASLGPGDTVYGVTPIHHPSSLLMSIGGAIAGGARLAMASHFNPTTFWDEARRYGVTVSTYTWTLLHDLAEAPPDPRERHHPIRLFMGSGMPRGLWRRVEKRFAPARVVEFYASTEGGAILVNLGGSKPGAMGRPLPGSAELRIAAWDPESGELALGPDGLARECATDVVGMLLARADATTTATTMRGLFEPHDAWLATGDLFRRDADGDHWLVDHVHALVPTREGLVATRPITDALAEIRAVDLVVAYGVVAGDAGVVVAAVSLRPDRELTGTELSAALAPLDPAGRPAVVRVVEEIPVTSWFRPQTAPLAAEGIPKPGGARPVWVLDRESGEYAELTPESRGELLAAA